MEVFQSNRREEKKLAKKIKRKHKRYWIGYLVAAALCVLMWIRMVSRSPAMKIKNS